MIVDEFLMQSLVYEYVENQSARGLMVTSSVVIAKYLQMWSYQEKTPAQTRRMEKIQRSATSRWTWCRRFRKFWNLRWGIAPKGVNMTVSTMKRKAVGTEKSTTIEVSGNHIPAQIRQIMVLTRVSQGKKAMPQAEIYHQWMQWLLHNHLSDKPTVLLNMDETSVLSPLEKRRGIFHHESISGFRKHTFRRRGLRRCTLMAVIADDEELQKHLPQILLPRAPGGREPGVRAKRSYESLGQPLEVWHLTGGHNSADVMKMWIKAVAKKVRELRGDVHIVLTLDCHPVHISADILRSARAADVHTVLVPAGCTWFLQPLDVKVFQHLKSRLRGKVMAAENAAVDHAITWNDHMRAVASAVHETLVESTWTKSMKAMGVHRSWRPTAEPLRSLLKHDELRPQAPSEGDIMHILPSSRNAGKGELWRRLLRLPEADAAQRPTWQPQAADHRSREAWETTALEGQPSQPRRTRARHSDKAVFDPTMHTPQGMVQRSLREHERSAVNRPVHKEKKPRVGPAAGTRSEVAKGAAKSSRE